MDYINIGRLVASFGLKGELILVHALEKKTVLKDIEAVFIEMQKGSYIPYFVQASKARSKEEILVKLDGIDTKEQAHKLISKPVWLLNEDFRKLVGKSSVIALLGYQVVDHDQPVGHVEAVIEQPHQVLLKITYQGHEALIPLHEETLEKIDHKKQVVYVNLPDGLLDVYTS